MPAAKWATQVLTVFIAGIGKKEYPAPDATGQDAMVNSTGLSLGRPQYVVIGQGHKASITFSTPIARPIEKNCDPAY